MGNCITTREFLPISPLSFCMYTKHLIYSALLRLHVIQSCKCIWMNLINGPKHPSNCFFFFALLYFNKYLITSRILEPFLEPVLNLRGETYQRKNSNTRHVLISVKKKIAIFQMDDNKSFHNELRHPPKLKELLRLYLAVCMNRN